MAQLFVGLMAEGSTDYRFLKPIVEKTLFEIAFNEINQEIEILVFDVEYVKGDRFVNNVFEASKRGFTEYGIMSLVIHADADALSSENVYRNKISPAILHLDKNNDLDICREIIPIVPVYETESWMLANKELFKKHIGTNKADLILGIDGNPEQFSRPKERIEDAIRIARQDLPSKIRNLMTIKDLYSILGESITIQELSVFDSYLDFQNNIRNSLKRLNLLN